MTGSVTLADLRVRALRIFLALLWAQLPLVGLACWAAGQPINAPLCMSLLLAGCAQVLARLDETGDRARLVAAVSIMASISGLVGVLNGQKMQVDLHMYYFAALAILEHFAVTRIHNPSW